MIGGLAAAAGSLGAAGISGAFGAREASKNRKFQMYMADTQYRRAVKDMRAAGLNPILAAGGSAGVPSGATAPGISVENPVSAFQSYRVQKEAIKNAREQNKNLQATRDNLEAQNVFTKAQTAKALQEARLTGANADQAEVLKGLYKAAVPFIHDLQDWANSARSASEKSGSGILKGIWDSLINSANDALPGTEERNRRNREYKDRLQVIPYDEAKRRGLLK